MTRRVALMLAVVLVSVVPAVAEQTPLLTPQDRSVDPVVIQGSLFPAWSAGPELSFREPQLSNDPLHLQSDCADDTYPDGTSDHSCQNTSRLPVSALPGRTGVATERLLGYRWTGSTWAQIPFQVDERFTRYLTNNASGFAFYSGADQHLTYAFDREGFRFTDNYPLNESDPAGSICRAKQRGAMGVDPVPGLDDNDELVFMYSDTGVGAPQGEPLPSGIESAVEVAVVDPLGGAVRYAYVMLAAPGGPSAAFDAGNGYVRYARDADADLFVFSESSYEDYGAAPKGPYCEPDGTYNGDTGQRRPKDTAWIYTPRYKFRYEGRWLLTQLHVHPQGTPAPVSVGNPSIDSNGYGPDLIDRWKARAFAQDPGSETPCCGYEEEDTNWGGSSILMGERWGPVRTIRETWGADSSTNNARRETFYRDSFVWGDALRVHPIPPLDGIYAQWDYNIGAVSTYYNPTVPGGVAIDGRNDEVFGNLDDPCNTRYDSTTRPDQIDEQFRQAYRAAGLCALPYHQSVDISDPTISGVQALQWEEIAGPHGSLILRTSIRDHTPGGDAQSLLAVPYYRDDSCFDDGTGSSPGPKLHLRSGDEPTVWRDLGGATGARRCWEPGDPMPDPSFVNTGPFGDREGDERYYQGSIGTTGLHLLVIVESDNAMLTVPVTEINSEQRIVVLEGNPGNVGESYGRGTEHPLVIGARPLT